MLSEQLSPPGCEAHGDPAKSAAMVAQPALDVISAIPAATVKSALLVSPWSEDHEFLGETFIQQNWKLYGAQTLGSALALLRDQPVPVVITERDLQLGNWKDLLAGIQQLAPPPLLIIASRLADEYLWSEVLNLGGHDVLAKPFRAAELRWVLEGAWRITAQQEKSSAEAEFGVRHDPSLAAAV
jgi:DNA-binding response OmpR family regulator